VNKQFSAFFDPNMVKILTKYDHFGIFNISFRYFHVMTAAPRYQKWIKKVNAVKII